MSLRARRYDEKRAEKKNCCRRAPGDSIGVRRGDHSFVREPWCITPEKGFLVKLYRADTKHYEITLQEQKKFRHLDFYSNRSFES